MNERCVPTCFELKTLNEAIEAKKTEMRESGRSGADEIELAMMHDRHSELRENCKSGPIIARAEHEGNDMHYVVRFCGSLAMPAGSRVEAVEITRDDGSISAW